MPRLNPANSTTTRANRVAALLDNPPSSGLCDCCDSGADNPQETEVWEVESGSDIDITQHLCRPCVTGCSCMCRNRNCNVLYFPRTSSGMCLDCDRDYRICNYCSNAVRRDSVLALNPVVRRHFGYNSESRFCSSCFASLNRSYEHDMEERAEELDDEVINDYYAKISSHPFKNNHGLYQIGFELEVETMEESEDDARRKASKVLSLFSTDRDSFGRYLICKHDGSLDYGFEIVSRPMTLDGHKKVFSKFFSNIPDGLISSDSERCGLHIHVNKATDTPQQMSKLQKGKLRAFTDAAGTQRYLDYICGRRANSHCNRSPGRSFVSGAQQNYDRYVAWNETPDTMEFRSPKGTLVPETFWSRLEFVVAQCRWTSTCSVKQSSSLDCFTEWLKGNAKEFPALYAKTIAFLGGELFGQRGRSRERRGRQRRNRRQSESVEPQQRTTEAPSPHTVTVEEPQNYVRSGEVAAFAAFAADRSNSLDDVARRYNDLYRRNSYATQLMRLSDSDWVSLQRSYRDRYDAERNPNEYNQLRRAAREAIANWMVRGVTNPGEPTIVSLLNEGGES